LFECVVNVSEGRRVEVLDQLALAAGASLRDRHSDPTHNRSVFTLIHHRTELRRHVQSFVVATMKLLDLRHHEGVHPRFGVLDVMPFVALDPRKAEEAISMRNEVAAWVADTFDVPVFLYGRLRDGSKRSLPEVRRHAFHSLMPDLGPLKPSPERGSSAIGARPLLVAWNLWVRGISLGEANIVAKALRRSEVRVLAFEMPDDFLQISFNLVDPLRVTPSMVYDEAVDLLSVGTIDRVELVGLIPEALLELESPKRWKQLGLSKDATIESRLA
jgi:glutamate formiminotransferase / 5-formyltetrahydrofolate cyclo-ligase